MTSSPHDALFKATPIQVTGQTIAQWLEERGEARGKIVEARRALRRVLSKRGLTFSSAQEARIDSCEDLAILERWHDQAITATSASDVLQ